MKFAPVTLNNRELALQQAVRDFLDRELPPGSFEPGLGLAGAHDPQFSRLLAAQGWVGMTLPRRYGGQDASAVERFLVTEVLLARGAPIGAHWIAERQSAPAILRYGSETLKERLLPAIAAGECYFSIGMSEPDSGSDLASIRTRAERSDGGWVLHGTKTWTSMAHRNHWFIVLARTSRSEDRHGGLSQFVVDLAAPGVTVRPILFMNGGHHFNEVQLDGVFVPDECVLGEIGDGWRQVIGELAYERSGPDRYLSTYLVLSEFLRAGFASGSVVTQAEVGRLASRLWGLRQMSLSIARSLDGGAAPRVEAAVAKDLGTAFENEVVAMVRRYADVEPDPSADSLLLRLLAESVVTAPTFTIRGGTSEVLRSIISRELVGR